MKCKWKECDNEARAKSPFCSGTCKKRYQRASGTDVPVKVGQEQVGQSSGTRPPIPGDPDYVGVCKQVDGEWVVRPDPPAPVASLSDIDLQLRLQSYPACARVGSPEHREVLSRRRQGVAV